MTTPNPKAVTADELLAFIKARQYASETDVMHQFNPEPPFPVGGDELATDAWRKAREAWMDATYGGKTVPYRETVSSYLSGLAVELDKAGKIRTTNNGYNCYTYHFLHS